MSIDDKQLKKATGYAFLLLKYRPRSIAEFTEKLTKRGFSQDIIDELLNDFKKRGFLDDLKFAKLLIQDRIKLKPMGRFKLKQELNAKGISEFDSDDALEAMSGEMDEYEAASKLAQSKLKQFKGVDKVIAKRRLASFLGRRGFSYDAVFKAVKEATAK